MTNERFEQIIAALQWKRLIRLPRKIEIGRKIIERECKDETELQEFIDEAERRFSDLYEAMGDSLYNYPPRFGYLGDDTIIDGLWGIIPLGWNAYQKVLQKPESLWSFYKDARQIMATESFAYIIHDESE